MLGFTLIIDNILMMYLQKGRTVDMS